MFDKDEELIAQAVAEARHIQEFIWGAESLSRKPYNARAWAKVFQKRVDAITDIDFSQSSAMVELRKRLLQQAALSIKALVVLAEHGRNGNHAGGSVETEQVQQPSGEGVGSHDSKS